MDRDVATDELWVGLIHGCILYNNDLIWERIKVLSGLARHVVRAPLPTLILSPN
jgi:hypothetical protein